MIDPVCSSPFFVAMGAQGTEEVHERQERKRTLAISHIKTTPEYINYLVVTATEYLGEDQQPLTPNPLDRGLSKRLWEKSVMAWRRQLLAPSQSSMRDGKD